MISEKQKAYFKAWYAKNKSRHLINQKRWYRDNAEKARKYGKDYNKQHYIPHPFDSSNCQYNKNICRFCKKENIPLMKSSKYKDKQYYSCRDCNTKRLKKYRGTPKGKISSSNNQKRMIKKYPQKVRARTLLNHALITKKIIKPKKCTVCFKSKKIQAHHEDYTKPLDIIWLCIECHRNTHKNLLT